MPLWPFSKKKAEDNNYDYDDSYDDDDFEEDIVDEDLNTTGNTSRGSNTRHSHRATAGHSHSYDNGGDAPAELTDSTPDTAPATSTSEIGRAHV